jgi:hypothetical protein
MEDPCYINSECFHDIVYNNTTLYVPSGTIDKYKSTDYWNRFVNIIEGVPTGIDNITPSQKQERFDIRGNRLESPRKGLNIIRMNNGKSKKVLIK